MCVINFQNSFKRIYIRGEIVEREREGEGKDEREEEREIGWGWINYI